MFFIWWILLGALAGWLASLIMRTDSDMGAVENIVVGILGAILGGFIVSLFGAPGADLGRLNLYSLVVAVGGAVILIWLYRMVRRGY